MEATVSRPRHRERPLSLVDEDIQEEEAETVASSTTERRGFNDPDLVERVKTLEVINDDPSRNQEEEEDRDIRDSTKPSYLKLENIRSLGDNSPKNERDTESKYPRVTKIPQSMVPQVMQQQQQQQYAYIVQDPQMSQPVYDLYSNNSYFSTQPYPLTANDQLILSPPTAPPVSLPPSRPHSPPSFHRIFLQGSQGNGAAPIGTTNPAPQAQRSMDAQEPVERFSRYISMFDCPFCLKNLSANEPVVSLGCCKRPYHLNCAGSRSQWFAFNSKPGTVQRSFCPYCARPDTDEDRIISNIKKKRRAMEKVAEDAITSLFNDNDKQLKVFDIIGEVLSTSSPTYSFELLKQLKIPFVNKFSWSFKFGGTGGGESGDDKATGSRLEFDDTGVPKEAGSGDAQQQQSIPQPAAPQPSSGGNSDDPSVQVIHILKRIDERRKMIEKRVSGGRITPLERRIFDSFLNSNPIEPLQTLLSKKSSGNWLGPDGSSRITYRGLVDNGVGLGKLLSWGFCLSTLELELGMTEGREDLEYGGFEPSMLKTLGDEILALHERYRIDADYLLERFHITVEQLAALELHSTSLAILGFTTHKLCLMGMVKAHIPLMNIHLERWIETLCMRKEHIFILDINGRDLIRGEGALYSSTWNMESIMKRFNLTFHESEFLGFPEATRREHEIEAAAAAKAAALAAEASKRAENRTPNPASENKRAHEMRPQHIEICAPYSPQPPAAREQQAAAANRRHHHPFQLSREQMASRQEFYDNYGKEEYMRKILPPVIDLPGPSICTLYNNPQRWVQRGVPSPSRSIPSQHATANRRPPPRVTLGEHSVSSLSYRPSKDALPQMEIPGAKMSVKNRFN